MDQSRNNSGQPLNQNRSSDLNQYQQNDLDRNTDVIVGSINISRRRGALNNSGRLHRERLAKD